MQRFDVTLARGHARYRLWVRKEIKARGAKTHKGAGSVNLLALLARNLLAFDRAGGPYTPPDLTGARERVRDVVEKLREKWRREGRETDPAAAARAVSVNA